MKKIDVSNVNELYAAVNNPAHAGYQILLAAGLYTLYSTLHNPGRLELQKDMELQGQKGDPSLVIIDASGLPAGSFVLPTIPGVPVRTGAIRVGNGNNKIEWMTVKGNNNALSTIDTDLHSQLTEVEIAHLIVSGSLIGIDIRNGGAISAGRKLEAHIHHNELVDTLLQGMVIQNSVGATGAIINADLKNNYSHRNKVGIRVWNQHTNLGQIKIESKEDRFDENGIGIIINAGNDKNNAGAVTTANGNSISFKLEKASIQNNIGADAASVPDLPPPGGFYIAGGFTFLVPNRTSNNTVEIELKDCTIANNQGTDDINAFGARSLSTVAGIAGNNNIVNIHLHGKNKNTPVVSVPGFPLPAGTNMVNIFR